MLGGQRGVNANTSLLTLVLSFIKADAGPSKTKL